jgi:acetylornithine/LysW-gamma-L-lysine aminotransferase
MPTTQEIMARESLHGSGTYPKRDIAIVRGQGARVWDAEGREYIDCASGHGVAIIGHANPAVADAISRQSHTLITCPGIFYNDQRAAFLEKLTSLAPSGLGRAFLCNSGAEAVEGALKLARLATGRSGIVATMRGFHGRTLGALSATWEKRYRQPFEPLVPGFTHVRYDSLEAMAQAVGEDTAGVIVEIVQGEGGVRPGSGEYFQGLRTLCDETGALLIVDEVQTGFGRTGRLFACEHHQVTPDVMCLGKGIAGGVPMGATLFGDRVGEMSKGAHGSTFGGNPLACAAGLAAIDYIVGENLPAQAAEKGAYLQDGLRRLESPAVREVRGLGLMVGIELRGRVQPYLVGLMERGVLALPAGRTVLRLLPPLTISREELDAVLSAIEEVLES